MFAKVGDSNTAFAGYAYGLGCRRAVLGRHPGLAATLKRHMSVRFRASWAIVGCSPSNSFSRESGAARSGSWSSWSLESVPDLVPGSMFGALPACKQTETPLTCEIRMLKPRYTLIMTGTNDLAWLLPLGAPARKRINQLVTLTRQQGSIPILSTIPPLPPRFIEQIGYDSAKWVQKMNSEIIRVARERRVPLINLWRAMKAPEMINDGLQEDNLHLSVYPGGTGDEFARSVNFTRKALRYGFNRRNLLALQTLKRLDMQAAKGKLRER